MKKFYVGATQETVAERLVSHNLGKYGKGKYTSVVSDWQIYLIFEARNYPHSIRMERKIKSMKSSVYIRNLKKYSEL